MSGVDGPDQSSRRPGQTALASVGRWWSSLRLFAKVSVVLIPIAVLAVVLGATLGEGGTNKQTAALAAFCSDEQLLQTSFRIQAMSQLAGRLPGDVQLLQESGDAKDAAAVERRSKPTPTSGRRTRRWPGRRGPCPIARLLADQGPANAQPCPLRRSATSPLGKSLGCGVGVLTSRDSSSPTLLRRPPRREES